MKSMKSALSLTPLFLAVLTAAFLTAGASVLAESHEQQPLGVVAEHIAPEDEFADYQYEYDYHDLSTHDQRHLQSTETTRCNFWCMLKNSMGLTIVGLLLICIAPCLMWKNEGRHVRELRRIDFCKNEAVVVEDVDNPSIENVGSLVHFVGEVTVGVAGLELAPAETGLNVTEPVPRALIVKRTCYIYQKFEDANSETKKDVIGGGQTTVTNYTVREDWTAMGPEPAQLEHLSEETNDRGIWDNLVEASGSSDGGDESAHDEPGASPPPNPLAALFQLVDHTKAPHGIAISPSARVGGFGLSEQVITEEKRAFQTEWEPVPSELIPDKVEGIEGLIKGSDGVLRTFPEGDEPTNGDCKVVYEYVADGFDCTFIVEQVVLAAEQTAESAAEEEEERAPDPEVGAKYGVSKADVIDDKCCGTIHDNLGVVWMVRRGVHDLAEMIDLAKQEEKMLTKLLRIIFWIVLVAGWVMLFSIFTTVLSTLPLLGQLGYFAVIVIAFTVGTVCCCGVTAIAYMRYRPLVSFGILALAGGIYGIVAWRLNEADKSSSS